MNFQKRKFGESDNKNDPSVADENNLNDSSVVGESTESKDCNISGRPPTKKQKLQVESLNQIVEAPPSFVEECNRQNITRQTVLAPNFELVKRKSWYNYSKIGYFYE
uniref:Uncharacterized protein n=1 Tax=Panagrolaimus sp. ES5 TaxID=591445 RepID=A0AC34FXI1_9BILA